jgi:hypothetical protein
MDPDTALERLAMLSLDDKATADDNKKKEEENKQDKEAPGEMPRPKNTWRRIPREVQKTTDKQEEQVEQAEDKKRLPERAWEEEGNYNSYQEEEQTTWPRWRGYSTEKGTYTRHWEDVQHENQNQSSSSSSNQGNYNSYQEEKEKKQDKEAKFFWNQDGVWEFYNGLWWKQDETGYGHRWLE